MKGKDSKALRQGKTGQDKLEYCKAQICCSLTQQEGLFFFTFFFYFHKLNYHIGA